MSTAEIMRRVRQLRVTTGRAVADVLAGEYVSAFKGRGMEFDEVRPYLPGDDVRSIDWNVTARAGSPFVKRYVEERELTIMMVCDISPSEDFGSGRRSKREAGGELAALVALSAVHHGDKVGLVLFDDQVRRFVPPRKGQKHALRLVREVLGGDVTTGERREERRDPLFRRWLRRWRELRASPRRLTDISAACEFLRQVLRRRCVVFLLSDFLDEGDYLPALRRARRRHDVVAVRLRDPLELDWPKGDRVFLEDAESGRTLCVDGGAEAFRVAYRARAAAESEALRRGLAVHGIDLIAIDEVDHVLDPLIRFFRLRERRRRRPGPSRRGRLGPRVGAGPSGADR